MWKSVLALAVALASAGAAGASFSVSNVVGAAASNYSDFQPPPDSQTASQFGVTGPVTSSVVADQGDQSRFVVGHGFSSATIDLGYFSGTADSTAFVPRGSIATDGTGREYEYFASSYADVTADSGDSILVMPGNPMLIGTIGAMVVPIDVSGTVAATITATPPRGALPTPYAYTQWSVFASTLGGNPAGLLGGVDSYGFNLGDVPGLHTLMIDVVLGVPNVLTLSYGLHSTAYVQSALGVGGQVEGIVAFGSTIRWMGISQVLDAEGSPIDFTVTSDSGFDWTQPAPTPVPVPPLPLSLLAAVGAAGARFGRRRSARKD